MTPTNSFSLQSLQLLRRASLVVFHYFFNFFICMYRVFVLRQRLSFCPLWRAGSSPGEVVSCV